MTTWPLFPNWSSGYRETYAFLTEIIGSEAGREQRRALRIDPRMRFEYDALVSRQRFQTMRRAMANTGADLVFPDERQSGSLASSVGAGVGLLNLGTVPAWVTPGRQIILEHPELRQRAAHAVTGVAGGTVSLASATDRAWGAGTLIRPAFAGRLAQSTSVSIVTDRVGTLPVALDVDPGAELVPVTPAGPIFNGREVFVSQHNWRSAIGSESTDATQWTDFETGVRAPYNLTPFGTEVIRQSHLIKDDASFAQTVGLFLRMCGRQGEVYVPSGMSDFDLSASVETGSKDWRIPGVDFRNAYVNDPVHKAFQVTFRTGEVMWFRVASIVSGSDGQGGFSRVQTIEAAPRAIHPTDVAMISWMPVCRFATDELTVSWETNRVAQVELNFMTLEDI